MKEEITDQITEARILVSRVREVLRENKKADKISDALKQIEKELGKIRDEIIELEKVKRVTKTEMKILQFIRKHGKVTVKPVQQYLGHKNPASTYLRLNELYRRRILKKGRIKKEVFYWY